MSTPVIQENDNDVELTYTLDTIRMEDGTVTVSASNSFNSQEWKENNLQTDTLIDIFSYLERNEKNLFKEQ